LLWFDCDADVIITISGLAAAYPHPTLVAVPEPFDHHDPGEISVPRFSLFFVPEAGTRVSACFVILVFRLVNGLWTCLLIDRNIFASASAISRGVFVLRIHAP
jgi:hypothetical protein